MKSTPNKASHVVKGNVFEAIGFSQSEATALTVKAEILSAILEHIRGKRYTQAQLGDILDEHQPSVSNLLRGRIGNVSIEKLLRYADRLRLKTNITVQAMPPRRVNSRRASKQMEAAGD